MNRIHIAPAWALPSNATTPEAAYLQRREFLRRMGFTAGGALLLSSGVACAGGKDPWAGVAEYGHKFKRSLMYQLDRPLTARALPASFNNFYEFTTAKDQVWRRVSKFKTKPWQIEIGGHCKRKGKFDLDEVLKKLPQEERLYRFRCVETWAMAVPWIGVPMREFIKWAEPTGKAKYVQFITAWRPKQMPAPAAWVQNFPYNEALRLDEANNELTLLATGLYGHELPRQNGAPVRLIVPWKYGYKSAKSIVQINFIEKQPPTFWNALNPREYGFFSNVNPKVPHPRWSQAQEWMIPNQAVRRPTLLFNGYGQQVASLYKGMDLKKYH